MQNSYELQKWLTFSEEALVDLLKGSCRLCMSQGQASINLMTKERNGTRLMDMANLLTDIQVNEHDQSKSLFLCLSCAGKLVHYYEFRELCQKNDEKLDTIDTALRLKQRNNQTNGSILLDIDDNMEIMYVCKVCKMSFHENNEYLQHKDQHLNQNGEYTDSAKENEELQSLAQPEVAATSTSANLYECRSCPRTFRTYISRHSHESRGHQNQDTVVATKRKHIFKRLRNSSGTPSIKPETSGTQSKKQFGCSKCDQVFSSFKAKWWHELKIHTPKEKKPAPQCRYCGNKFNISYQKYNHERVCPMKIQMKQELLRQDEEPNEPVLEEEPEMLVTEVNPDETIKRNDDTNGEKELHQCSRCDQEFTSLRGRSIHEKKYHNLDVNECRVCTRVFNSYGARYVHERKCALRLQEPEQDMYYEMNSTA